MLSQAIPPLVHSGNEDDDGDADDGDDQDDADGAHELEEGKGGGVQALKSFHFSNSSISSISKSLVCARNTYLKLLPWWQYSRFQLSNLIWETYLYI